MLLLCLCNHHALTLETYFSIHLNKYTKYSFRHIDHAVAVSHRCRENLILCASFPPERVSVIPNAVDTSKFSPDCSLRKPLGTVNIVSISRLTYRKGVDLLVPVIAALADWDPNLYFIVGGDGPKRLLLEEMREKYELQDRIEMLGVVERTGVR